MIILTNENSRSRIKAPVNLTISVSMEVNGNHSQLLGSIDLNGHEFDEPSGKVYGKPYIQESFPFSNKILQQKYR
jgi:hypothetical protein